VTAAFVLAAVSREVVVRGVVPDPVVLAAEAGEVVVQGVVVGPLVEPAVAGQLVIRRVVADPVVGPPDLDRAPAVVIPTVVDAAQTGQGDPTFQRLEPQAAPAAFPS
jgi:hypothetical protein